MPCDLDVTLDKLVSKMDRQKVPGAAPVTSLLYSHDTAVCGILRAGLPFIWLASCCLLFSGLIHCLMVCFPSTEVSESSQYLQCRGFSLLAPLRTTVHFLPPFSFFMVFGRYFPPAYRAAGSFLSEWRGGTTSRVFLVKKVLRVLLS